MKKKKNVPMLIVCAVLCIALLLSVFLLFSARADVKELEEQLQVLSEENQQLSNLNQTLRIQLDSYFLSKDGSSSIYIEEDYCSLMVNSWSVKDGVLKVDAFAEAFLTDSTYFTSKIELWRGDAVLTSQPVTLNPSEAVNAFEADVSVAFEIPEISAGEELQLWLMVEPAGGDPLFGCAAGWYLENGELVIISG